MSPKPFKYSGTVSSGTLRPEDLIPTFMDVLDEIKEDLSLSYQRSQGSADGPSEIEISARVGRSDDLLGTIEERRRTADRYWDSDDSGYDLSELEDALQDLAPEGYYFGAHPGDGADFGFWLIDDDAESESLPACASVMGCLCAFHARGGAPTESCDARE